MLKTIFSRVLSKRKATVFVVMALGILVLTAVAAVAQTYTTSTKPSLKLNKTSLVGTALTTLASNAPGPALTLRTDSTDPNATPLSLDTKMGEQAPMKVDSETKVENLNAAKVDGKGPEEFMPSQRYVTSGLLDSGTSTPNGEWVSVDVVCDFEDVLLSGGVHLNDPQEDRIAESWPKDPLLGGWEWTGGMIDNGGHDYGSVWALCADYPPLRQ